MIFAALFASNKKDTRRDFTSTDGTSWKVEVRSPTASNAMVVFLHPDPDTSMRNRYAWWLSDGPESRDVRARLTAKTVLAGFTDADIAGLFKRSMPISSQQPRFEPA